MEVPAFKIRNLTCAYVPQKPVLTIEELDIPRGKLVFVIGQSGIGKSTFIETLGLMNKTIVQQQNTAVQFFPIRDQSGMMELKNSWTLPDEQQAAFRRNHFSFIFQSTNLMPNFSAGENMMISALINDMSKQEAEKVVRDMMKKLSLDTNVFDEKITELSGGQRQRLAFVRAVVRDFTVLYGDEPTGNLDQNIAEDLMNALKSLLQSNSPQRTGIIVSHNLHLAYKFADLIVPIVIEKIDEENSYGAIYTKNLLTIEGAEGDRRIMRNRVGTIIEEPISYLSQFLSTKTQTA